MDTFSDRIPETPIPEGFYSEPLRNRKRQKLEKEGRDNFMANITLEDAQIISLLAGTRQKGAYKAALEAFVAEGNKGERVDNESGTFAGKSLTSLYQSFNSNAKEHFPNVRVVKNDEGVYLINTELV